MDLMHPEENFWEGIAQFVNKVYMMARTIDRTKKILIVTNCLPTIPSILHKSINFGRIKITFDRFLCDLSDTFSVII